MVRLDTHYVEVSNAVQTFKWNGAWCILRFDCRVPVDIGVDTIILKFDVVVEGLPIVAIRPEIGVTRKEKESKKTSGASVIEQRAPRSAFASYAKKDRRDVLGRVRSLQIFTGIDVFLDCLSIRPSEDWKLKLKNEIHERDIFWLFWSRRAMASEWVEWEWRTALAEKSLAAIQPHPLEPAELAPPPLELSSLQFGAMYEWYVSQLRESRIAGVFRRLLHKVSSLTRRG
jgi:TIR domain